MQPTPDEEHWSERFARERARLLAALGSLPDGGIVEQVEHVGATSVPGLPGRPIIDLTMAVWPFPLEAEALSSLLALGYVPEPHAANSSVASFTSTSGTFHLALVEAGNARVTDDALLRDYLRADEAARRSLSALKASWEGADTTPGYAEAKRRWFDEHLGDAHHLWIEREGFAPVLAVADELRAFERPWSIGGGWALDLFLGRVARVHYDLDVAIARADQFALREYLLSREWKLLTPHDDRLYPWPEAMRLELPRHQIHAHRDGAFIDFLLADVEGGVWRFRRNPALVRDVSRVRLSTADGIPYLAPELVLLYKSKTSKGESRDKDQADFEKVRAHLEPERRAWLRWALTAYDPSHRWLAQL